MARAAAPVRPDDDARIAEAEAALSAYEEELAALDASARRAAAAGDVDALETAPARLERLPSIIFAARVRVLQMRLDRAVAREEALRAERDETQVQVEQAMAAKVAADEALDLARRSHSGALEQHLRADGRVTAAEQALARHLGTLQ